MEVDQDTFTAELVPESSPGPTLIADFPRALISDEPNLQAGDVVYVISRTVVGREGYDEHTTSVRLRRLGLWTEDEIEQQRLRARSRHARLKDFID